MHFVGFTDSLGILVEHLDTDLRDVKELTLIILYNLCVGYRSKIFSNGKQHPITNHVAWSGRFLLRNVRLIKQVKFCTCSQTLAKSELLLL